jgi:GrpB-like predicted nucleotidyltransferase (UPF0157 family)
MQDSKSTGAIDEAFAGHLQAITIGAVKRLDGTVDLEPHDPRWASAYLQRAAGIRAALGSRLLLLEHVGSTSIPALAAKPIIDMVMAVCDPADEGSYVPALERLGYLLRIREPEWLQHRLLENLADAANLHVFSSDCEEIKRMVMFRDWLRTHPADRSLYENRKRELAAQRWQYLQQYADAKSEVVGEIMARAIAAA